MANNDKNQGGSKGRSNAGRGAQGAISDKATHHPGDDQKAPTMPSKPQGRQNKNGGEGGQGHHGTGNRISDRG